MSRKATNSATTIGIDIGKNNFHLIGLDGAGNIVLRRKLSRSQVQRRYHCNHAAGHRVARCAQRLEDVREG